MSIYKAATVDHQNNAGLSSGTSEQGKLCPAPESSGLGHAAVGWINEGKEWRDEERRSTPAPQITASQPGVRRHLRGHPASCSQRDRKHDYSNTEG